MPARHGCLRGHGCLRDTTARPACARNTTDCATCLRDTPAQRACPTRMRSHRTRHLPQWTLDYPPLFAWFERLLAVGARLVDPQILTLSSTPYISHTTLGYQRATVIASDIVLLLGCRRFANAISSSTTASTTSTSTSTTASAASILSFLNAGLLLVDHMHFQYNGMLIGLLLLSIAELRFGSSRPLSHRPLSHNLHLL